MSTSPTAAAALGRFRPTEHAHRLACQDCGDHIVVDPDTETSARDALLHLCRLDLNRIEALTSLLAAHEPTA